MRFAEVNVFGVYIAPISILIVAAWIATVTLRRAADRFGLLGLVWHPALFVFSIYVILLSSFVLFVAR